MKTHSTRLLFNSLRISLAEIGCTSLSTVLVAYSGGPDSTALLVSLAALPESVRPLLRAVHVNHGMRPAGELEAERASVISLCRSLSVGLTIVSISRGRIKTLASRKGCGLEAAARIVRLKALEICARRTNAVAIFTGHTLDDQLETILMRFFSGAGCEGLTGIPKRRELYVRPFLDVSKKVLLEFLSEKQVSYSLDSTNQGLEFHRNRFRHELVPVLDRLVPGWPKAIRLASSKAQVESSSIRELDSRFDPLKCQDIIQSDDAIIIQDIANYLLRPQAARVRSLAFRIQLLAGAHFPCWRTALQIDEKVSSGKLLFEVAGFHGKPFTRDAGPDKKVDFKQSLVASENFAYGNSLYLSRTLDFPRLAGYFFTFGEPGYRVSNSLSCRLVWHEVLSGTSIYEGTFQFPLSIRTRLPGDRLDTGKGHRPLDQLFRELGISPEKRNLIPIVEDASGIVAIFGFYGGGKNRFRQGVVTSGARSLHVELKGVGIPDGF